MSLPFKQAPNSGPSKEEPTHSFHVCFRTCASDRDIFEHNFMVANVMSGWPWDKQFSLAATARNMVVSSCPNSGSMLPSLSSTLVSPPGRNSWRRGLTGTFESQSFDHLFQMARVCFYPKPSGTPSYRSVEDLELLVQIRVLISYLSVNFWITHSTSSLEDWTVTSLPWTEVLIPRASSEYKHVLACQQPALPTAWSSSVSFGELDVDSALRLRMDVRSSHVNHQEHCLLLVA